MSLPGRSRFPGAAQRETVRCRPGIAKARGGPFLAVPHLRCTASGAAPRAGHRAGRVQ
jgi:hypothetical protein